MNMLTSKSEIQVSCDKTIDNTISLHSHKHLLYLLDPQYKKKNIFGEDTYKIDCI